MSWRKNIPIEQETHDAVVAELNRIELKGHGRPSITSWVKVAIMEKLSRDKEKERTCQILKQQ